MNDRYSNDITERERKLQIAEARRLARVSCRQVGEQPQQPKKSNRLKGHEVLLDAIRANKQVCEFCFLDNDIIYGVVEHSDATTVSVREQCQTDSDNSLRVIFKTSLKYFTPFQNKKGA